MSDTQESDDPISFTRWLFAQVKGDPDRTMPYAALYQWGPAVNTAIGSDGNFNSEKIALELSRQGATADDLLALASAEAAWRVDALVDSAETAGVSLDVPGGPEEVVSAEAGKEIAESSTKILCGFRNPRGEGCTAEAVPGAGRCGRHGGAITDPEVRRSLLLVAFAKVIDGSRVAVDALLDVAEHGRSEMARVQAAKELLDRAGVQQDQHVHIHKQEEDVDGEELVDEIRRRLTTAKDRLRITTVEIESYGSQEQHVPEVPMLSSSHDDDDIIDAVVVTD